MTNSSTTSPPSSTALLPTTTAITTHQHTTSASLLCPPPPPSPLNAQQRSLKRKIRSFTFGQQSPPLRPSEVKTVDPEALPSMASSTASHSTSPATSTAASTSLSSCPSPVPASPARQPTPMKHARIAAPMSTPTKSRTLLTDFQQLSSAMQPPTRRVSDGGGTGSHSGMMHKDSSDFLSSSAFTLPAPPSALASVPRLLQLHQHLQQHLQSQGVSHCRTPPHGLFPLSTASTATTAPGSPLSAVSPCSSPILAEAFPVLPPLDTDFLSSTCTSRLPPLPIPLSPHSPPPFSMASHLLASPARPSLPLSSLSPDPKAFAQQTELHKKTPKNSHSSHSNSSHNHNSSNSNKPYHHNPPPTPMRLKRPAVLQRASSLYETKMLESDLTPRGARVQAVMSDEGGGCGGVVGSIGCGLLSQSPHSMAAAASGSGGGGGAATVTFDGSFTQSTLVGEGSFFQVFRAIETATGECVAVKRSLRTFRGRKDRQGYMREVQLIKKLGPHPHIVKAHCAWQEELHLYIQMEYLPYTLEQWAEREQSTNSLTPAVLLSWALQLALALKHLHAAGLLHLDVKPENVLVSDVGMLKLGDFGSARGLDEVGDGSEGDSRYAALELLHVEKDGGSVSGGGGGGCGGGRLSSSGVVMDSIFLHPPRVWNEGGEMIEQPSLTAVSSSSSFLHCPSTPSVSILPPTNTNTPTSLQSNPANHSFLSNLNTTTNTLTPPSHSAPHSHSSGSVSYGTDIFSLGLLLLELASSIELPSSGSVWLDLRQGRAAGHVVGKVGSSAVEEVVLWCLRERVDERPTADELIAKLRGMVDVEKLRSIGVVV